MSNLHKEYPKNTTWEDLSDRLVKYYRLPHGSYFALSTKDGRIVRKDRRFSRKPLLRQDHPLDERLSISDIHKRIGALLAVNLKQLDWKVLAFGPGINDPLDTRTLLRKWQNMTPDLTAQRRESKAMRAVEIDEFLLPRALEALDELDEGIEDPEDKVPQAVIAALIRRYDVRDVKKALLELRVS